MNTGDNTAPLLGSAAGGQRFELVLTSDENIEDAEQPFLVLSDTGRFSRTFLARAVIGTGTTLGYYALKLQRSTYRPYSPGVSQSFPTNREIDEMWERELSNLTSATGNHLTRILDLGQDGFRSRPILFCRKSKRYFHPFCVNCLGFLATCQDEELLQSWNLPSYEKSAERFLYCAGCATGSSAVVYTLIKNPELRPGSGIEVRTRVDLFKDLCSADSQQDGLKAVFPCANAGCVSEGASHITPISFHDFHMIPLELEQLHYDEWMDLVGGASWDSVRASIAERSPDRNVILANLEQTLSRPFQWMHRNNSSDLFAIEVMRLKTSAFLQACHGLREYHAKTDSPHLSLDPANVMVSLPPGGPDGPARWNARTRLIDLGSAHRFRPMAALGEYFGNVFVPSPDLEKTYAAPAAKTGAMGQEEPMRITIQNVTTTEKGSWIEIDAVSPGARLGDFRKRDLVQVVPTSPISWLEGVDLWGTIVEPLEKGFRLSVFAPELTGEAKSPITVDGGVTFIRRLDLPCDIYSLGMLFFRSLLVNDEQDMFKVEDKLNTVINKLKTNLEGTSNPEAGFITDRLAWEIDAEADLFKPNSVLYSREDRNQTGKEVPAKIWQDALVLGFRLLSNIPHFSFCADHGDRDVENATALLDNIVQEVDQLNTRLQVELFDRDERNREIANLCQELQEEITGRELSG